MTTFLVTSFPDIWGQELSRRGDRSRRARRADRHHDGGDKGTAAPAQAGVFWHGAHRRGLAASRQEHSWRLGLRGRLRRRGDAIRGSNYSARRRGHRLYRLHDGAAHPQTPRWRIICPLSQEYAPGERSRFVDLLNGLLGGALGRESWTLSQGFFYGRVNGTAFEFHIGEHEQCLDEVDELEQIAQPFRARPGAGTKPGGPDLDDLDETELLEVIKSAAHFWGPAKRLLTTWAKAGVDKSDAEARA